MALSLRNNLTVADPGEGPGGLPPPLILIPDRGPKGQKKLGGRPPPLALLSQGLDLALPD